MTKIMTKLAPLSLLVLMVACESSDPYADALAEGKQIGYKEGYEVGYDEGKVKGDEAGYSRAKTYFESAGYNEGVVDGKKVGLNLGYSQGYTAGQNETYQPNYNTGYNAGYLSGDRDGERRGYDAGYDDGFDDRYDQVYQQGYNAGYNPGYADGKWDGERAGKQDGKNDGYDRGYDDGFYDGQVAYEDDFGSDDYEYDSGYDDYDSEYDDWDDYYDDYGYDLSVGKVKKLRGFANVLSLAHNQMFDYNKIPKPRLTKKGLVANGRVLLSETAITNKDTLKRASVVEQYLIVEMAKQVKSKFGLSAERSLKIAKASNHFRKFSSKRALTSEDTHAYASEIIGADFKEITKAYEQTLKGDLGAFSAVLKKAAEKNDTSPENISLILTKYFM